MGLRDLVARAASRQVHALMVEVPGWWRTRAAVERAVLARGWSLAFAPADADLLIVCGEPGSRLEEAVELVWHQLPGPRVRVDVREYDDVARRLDDGHAGLLDVERHRHDAQQRLEGPDLLRALSKNSGQNHSNHEGMNHGAHGGHQGIEHSDREGMDHSAHEGMGHSGNHHDDGMDHDAHRGMDHSAHEGMGHSGNHHDDGMDHDAHQGMDHSAHGGHGGMDMSLGGIPLAGGGEDRDGLEMDVLTVRLGPVLPHWPAGLVLRCLLQGDVIATADAEFVGPARSLDTPPDSRVRSMDNVVSVLALAGWDDAAAQARRVRDAVLEHGWSDMANAGLHRLRRKVRRSWLLRWSLRGIAQLRVAEVHHCGLPSDAVGDTHDRLIRMLDRAGSDAGHDQQRAYSIEPLARAITGLDLATARLVVASLDAHELRTAHSKSELPHG